ncbi:pesticidal protein Cry5Ba [Sulfurospirillum sp. T05]|uniref:Pesticidal protein Cry5Ba n=1 Tax=Sulfurospirillum tamanense TaxID=2813362 RepID=A0ABS2WV59_9BACT|nr:proton-conducting transporter membrane subunit [Sulfurospirillum tamanensis]MBN2965538.1 pesticidal protein Cry5Ba [Sulfurospirillum tamanensis]
MALYSLLLLVPFVMAGLALKLPFTALRLWFMGLVLLMSAAATALFVSPSVATFSLGSFFHMVLLVADLILLLYFLKEGWAFSSKPVWMLALAQLLMLLFAKSLSGGTGADFVLNQLAAFMAVVISVVGGLIVIFALWYIDQEPIDEGRKRTFIVMLSLFLGVMLLLVVANNLLIFFLLFELTTLASYLLISFRRDALSRANALHALWMNQIGGVFILSAVIIGSFQGVSPYFSEVLSGSALLVAALVAMAALVKGAQMPFDGWLLGAMVAPTPVSAILHSATMVKIAPFVVLKLSPLLANTLVADVLIVFGSCVFVIGGIYGLSRDAFKEILGYSTISLLGLMIAIAANGGNPTLIYALIFFHALSKALLFLLAGILEKNHHIKYVSQMDGLLYRAPLSAGMIILGFGTITLPPFGLFFGKLFSIEMAAANLAKSPAFLVLLIALAVGSALLVLLYFKVASLLFTKRADVETYEKEKGFTFAFFSPALFSVLLAFSYSFLIRSGFELSLTYVWLSLGMILLVPLWVKVAHFKGIDRVNEYYCGEVARFEVAQWSYALSPAAQSRIGWFGALAFGLILLGGVM